MKLLALSVVCASMVGCASAPATTASAPTPRAVNVDCRYAPQMLNDLENIIAQPSASNAVWDKTLGWVGGVGSPQQRLASAKTMLWNIRTQCRGY